MISVKIYIDWFIIPYTAGIYNLTDPAVCLTFQACRSAHDTGYIV